MKTAYLSVACLCIALGVALGNEYGYGGTKYYQSNGVQYKQDTIYVPYKVKTPGMLGSFGKFLPILIILSAFLNTGSSTNNSSGITIINAGGSGTTSPTVTPLPVNTPPLLPGR